LGIFAFSLLAGRPLACWTTGEVHTRSGQLSLLPIGRQTSTCLNTYRATIKNHVLTVVTHNVMTIKSDGRGKVLKGGKCPQGELSQHGAQEGMTEGGNVQGGNARDS